MGPVKLILATRNRHKLEEIRTLFDLPGLELSSALDHPDIPDVEEDGKTFEENAVKKALALARATGCWALADDSGLEVDALGGAPGVYSARYAGEPVSYPANNAKLLKALRNTDSRRAQFRCVIALASPSGRTRTVEGRCEGRIIHETRGAKGFGYDPLFVPDGHSLTFAEMDPAAKNTISHRGRALQKARAAWHDFLKTAPADWPDASRG